MESWRQLVMICGHEHTLPFMGRLRLQARSAVCGMGISRDLHCVTQLSNSMAMFPPSSPLRSHTHFPPKSDRTTSTLQIRHLMHYHCRRWRSFRQNCTDSCKKKCNRTKFPFFNPKRFVIQRNLPALRLLTYPYMDSSVCSD
jgi:hypothetical protein